MVMILWLIIQFSMGKMNRVFTSRTRLLSPFNESTAGESFSLPAPSIKKEQHSAATSISRQIFIFTLSSAANKRNLDASPQPRLVGESGLTRI